MVVVRVRMTGDDGDGSREKGNGPIPKGRDGHVVDGEHGVRYCHPYGGYTMGGVGGWGGRDAVKTHRTAPPIVDIRDVDPVRTTTTEEEEDLYPYLPCNPPRKIWLELRGGGDVVVVGGSDGNNGDDTV